MCLLIKDTQEVTKTVIIAAGFGTRFLPASKAVPKVMFPVIDRPIIQMVAEEVVNAGIKEIIFVLSPFTQEIRKHFEPFGALNDLLKNSGKEKEIEELKRIESMAKFSFTFQKPGPYGTGTAILTVEELVNNEPFVLLFADEFYLAEPPRVSQLVSVYQEFGGCVLGCIRTSKPEDGSRFGFVTGERINDKVAKVADLVEKPGIGKAPSDLASMSGMLFLPEIFSCFKEAEKELPPGKEFYQTYGIKKLLQKNRSVYAVEYQNYRYFDTGDRYGYLKALVQLGLENPQFGEDFKNYLKGLVKEMTG